MSAAGVFGPPRGGCVGWERVAMHGPRNTALRNALRSSTRPAPHGRAIHGPQNAALRNALRCLARPTPRERRSTPGPPPSLSPFSRRLLTQQSPRTQRLRQRASPEAATTGATQPSGAQDDERTAPPQELHDDLTPFVQTRLQLHARRRRRRHAAYAKADGERGERREGGCEARGGSTESNGETTQDAGAAESEQGGGEDGEEGGGEAGEVGGDDGEALGAAGGKGGGKTSGDDRGARREAEQAEQAEQGGDGRDAKREGDTGRVSRGAARAELEEGEKGGAYRDAMREAGSRSAQRPRASAPQRPAGGGGSIAVAAPRPAVGPLLRAVDCPRPQDAAQRAAEVAASLEEGLKRDRPVVGGRWSLASVVRLRGLVRARVCALRTPRRCVEPAPPRPHTTTRTRTHTRTHAHARTYAHARLSIRTLPRFTSRLPVPPVGRRLVLREAAGAVTRHGAAVVAAAEAALSTHWGMIQRSLGFVAPGLGSSSASTSPSTSPVASPIASPSASTSDVASASGQLADAAGQSHSSDSDAADSNADTDGGGGSVDGVEPDPGGGKQGSDGDGRSAGGGESSKKAAGLDRALLLAFIEAGDSGGGGGGGGSVGSGGGSAENASRSPATGPTCRSSPSHEHSRCARSVEYRLVLERVKHTALGRPILAEIPLALSQADAEIGSGRGGGLCARAGAGAVAATSPQMWQQKRAWLQRRRLREQRKGNRAAAAAAQSGWAGAQRSVSQARRRR